MGSPVGYGASLAAVAAPVTCRAGFSLLGMCSQQPLCVGLPSAWGRGSGMGSTAQATQYCMGRVKMSHRKLGLSPLLEEEDIETSLNSVLPCFLAS